MPVVNDIVIQVVAFSPEMMLDLLLVRVVHGLMGVAVEDNVGDIGRVDICSVLDSFLEVSLAVEVHGAGSFLVAAAEEAFLSVILFVVFSIVPVVEVHYRIGLIDRRNFELQGLNLFKFGLCFYLVSEGFGVWG